MQLCLRSMQAVSAATNPHSRAAATGQEAAAAATEAVPLWGLGSCPRGSQQVLALLWA